MKVKLKLLLIFLIISPIILPVYAETTTILSQNVFDHTFSKNATDNTDLGKNMITYYMLAGETTNDTVVSTIHINTHNIPKSDFWTDVKIDSTILKLLVVLDNGLSEKYLLTAHICTDGYEEKLKDRWLGSDDQSLPYTTHGIHKTQDCIRTSPQDSTIILKSDLPKIVQFDVTNLTRELIELGSRTTIYVITATPLHEEFPETPKIPPRELGILAMASKGLDQFFGGNVMATLTITYVSTPTPTVEILQNALVVVPPLAAIPISILLYWHGQSRSHKNLIRRNARSLRIEINENKEALSGERGYQIIECGSNIRYTNCFLDEDAYTSVLTSGEFTRLEVQTQTVLRELYSRIKDHNEQIKHTNELEDHFNIQQNNNQQNITERYEVNLTRLEEEIIQLIPQAITELNLEIQNQSNRFSLHR